jgi:hypothetical protein
MSLLATHLRFALDFQKHFQPTDLNSYLSGCVYPDSRYVTKIDRKLTHVKNYLSKDFYLKSDFHRGWAAHLLCDDAFGIAHEELFGKNLNKISADHDKWIFRTALKIVQDIDDAKSFDIVEALEALRYIETPNAEAPEVVKKYYGILSTLYSRPQNLNVKSYDYNLTEFGIDAEIIVQIQDKATELRQDTTLVPKIATLYDKMKISGEKIWNEKNK